MKNILIAIIAAALVIPGCATDKISTMDREGRHDVFQKVESNESLPAGYAELTVVSKLKTRKPGDWAAG